MKLKRSFYNRDTIIVAKELLGKTLVHITKEGLLSGIITETEAYIGPWDRAAHTYGGKMTKRTEPVFGPPGYAYIYFIYGLYYCLNVVTREAGIPECVLIRGLKPQEGIDEISQNRFGIVYDKLSSLQKRNLCDGPSKLCMALDIGKDDNKKDLMGDTLFITDENMPEQIKIEEGKRIGIDYAKEARDYLWRFSIR